MGGDQFGQGDMALERVPDHGTDELVRPAERHAPFHQPFGQVRGGGGWDVGGARHCLGVEGRRSEEPTQGFQGPVHLVDRVEEGLLVLLQVAVVGEREGPSGSPARRSGADEAPGLARASSAMSGFFFCGSIELPVA